MLLASGNKYRHYGLFIPLAIGIIFSITQEIMGAHFLSHDLFSFAICWSLSLAWFLVFFPDHFKESRQKQLE